MDVQLLDGRYAFRELVRPISHHVVLLDDVTSSPESW